MDQPFKFALNEQVRIKVSNEDGTVIGRSEHVNAGNQYLLRYRAADGRAVEAWWAEGALKERSE